MLAKESNLLLGTKKKSKYALFQPLPSWIFQIENNNIKTGLYNEESPKIEWSRVKESFTTWHKRYTFAKQNVT